jgi:hypothetical protein
LGCPPGTILKRTKKTELTGYARMVADMFECEEIYEEITPRWAGHPGAGAIELLYLALEPAKERRSKAGELPGLKLGSRSERSETTDGEA